MQQATVNLFADMSVQPATLQGGLTRPRPPRTPAAALGPGTPTRSVTAGTPVTVSGTATDNGGGRVGGVEVSVDGLTWHPATGPGELELHVDSGRQRPGHGTQPRCR